MNLNLNKSVTLLELIIAISLFAVLVVAFTSFDTYSRHHVIVSDRRARLQNELAYALEHMSKNIIQSVGDVNRRPITQLSNGFRVYRDVNKTPGNTGDDTPVDYTLSGNTLSCSLNSETLSTRISGFSINLTDNNTLAEIGLTARWNPAVASGVDNPQAVMKTKVYSRGSGAR